MEVTVYVCSFAVTEGCKPFIVGGWENFDMIREASCLHEKSGKIYLVLFFIDFQLLITCMI